MRISMHRLLSFFHLHRCHKCNIEVADIYDTYDIANLRIIKNLEIVFKG